MLRTLYQKYPILLLLLIGCLLFISNLGSLYVNIMEARNFVTAREMITHDHWIFTTLNDLPRYEKPPLPTWLTAISAWIFGMHNVFAYRLPAALSAIFLMLVFYKTQIGLKISKGLAFWSTLILATSFYVLFSGRDGQWDIYTHSFMLAGIYYFIKMITPGSKKIKNAIFGGLFLGASLLSKGPVSLYALFLPFLISYAIVFKISLENNIKPLLIFFITGIVTGSWWSLVVHFYDPEAFTAIAGQESSRWFSYNVRPIWYYWSFFTQSGIWTIPALMGLFYWYLKPRVANPKSYRFYFLWTLFIVILLSVIPEKKSRYLLPVLIPLAMTTGFYVSYTIKNFRFGISKIEKLPLYFNFIILSIVALAAPFLIYFFIGKEVWQMKLSFILFSVILILLGLTFLYALFKKDIKLLFCLQVFMIIAIINFGFPLVKLIDPQRNSPNLSTVKSIATSENITIYEASGTLPELVWEYKKPIPIATSSEEIPVSERNKFGILVEEAYDPDWKKNFPDYNYKLIDTLNLNPTISKKPNARLLREFYILTKH